MIPQDDKIEKNRLYRKARKQAREIKGFYIHLAIYCIVIPILIVINLTFVPNFYWFPFSMFGWGTGLLFHGFRAYQYTPFLGRDWEQKKLAQFMDEERLKKSTQPFQSATKNYE